MGDASAASKVKLRPNFVGPHRSKAFDIAPNSRPACLATKASPSTARGDSDSSADTIAVEHNIPTAETKAQHPPRRPDLSTFFSTLELVDTSNPEDHRNAHAQPQPENTAAAFRLLANAFEMMRGRPADEAGDAGEGGGDLLSEMIGFLRQNADDPPSELKGVPDSFLDELERVPNKSLKPTDTCPICVNPFLEGEWKSGAQVTLHLADSDRG